MKLAILENLNTGQRILVAAPTKAKLMNAVEGLWFANVCVVFLDNDGTIADAWGDVRIAGADVPCNAGVIVR